MSFIGATGLDEVQEQFDILKDNIDATNDYINKIYGLPDPTHTAIFGINILNPNLFGLVERAEVNIKALQLGEEGIGTDITGIQGEISGIQTEITGIQTEITGMQGEITAVEGSISSIQLIQLPALGTLIGIADGIAVDARNKANKSLGIWDESGNDVYHKKSGNVGIGKTFGSVLNNKLEVNGNINIPNASNYRINNEPLNYSHLAGTPPISSKWSNATDTITNIYYNTGNVGIGTISAINNKLEVGGNLNISAGSKYKINNVNLAFSDLGGVLSYNSLSDKPTLFDGNYNSLSNKPTLFDGNYNSLTNKLTQGTNINIVGNVINNTYSYSLPTAGIGAGGTLGGVRVDNSTIFINGSGVISSAGGTAQVNSDWTETNTSLKSFILNKPTIVNSRWGNTGADIYYNSGNVGIGTTNPFSTLHLHKTGLVQDVRIIISDGTTTASGSRGLHLIKSGTTGYLFNYENAPLLLGTNGTERMTIGNTGNVGIGTNAPQHLLSLHINNTTDSSRLTFTNNNTTTGFNNGFMIGLHSNKEVFIWNNENSSIQFGTNGAERMRILANGNVLIGSTTNSSDDGNTAFATPDSIFYVKAPNVSQGTANIYFRGGVAGGDNGRVKIWLSSDASHASYIENIHTGGGNTNLMFGTSSGNSLPIERMRIDANGNVGIGVSPSYKCHIKCSYNSEASGLHLDADDANPPSNPNKYSLTIWPYVIGGGQVGWRFKTQNFSGGTQTPFELTHDGSVRLQKDRWHQDSDGGVRLYFGGGSTTYINGNGSQPIEFRQNGGNTIAWFNTEGELTCMFESQSTTDSDHIIIRGNTALTQRGRYRMLIGYNSFTGFHRCYYEDDEVFNNDMSKEDIDIFKNNYKGRIVISTGKIKTDLTRDVKKEVESETTSDEVIVDEEIVDEEIVDEVKVEDITDEGTDEVPMNNPPTQTEETKTEWYSSIDKDGITIEDSIPIVQLCKVRKDKRVFGVLGSPTRSTNNKGRLIVNSIGEGAICVCNTNGNIENGDYIQSSDILGYGEKQDDDILHNYSVAKAVMDCTFELDSPYYQCYELANGVRVALIACTYHCG